MLRVLWQPVVVDGTRFLDPLTRGAAALMATGPDSVIADVSAAELYGFTAVSSGPTHVLVHHGRNVRKRRDLVVHRGTASPEDVVEVNGLRVLSIERVTSDLLCVLSPADALALADEVLRAAGAEHEEMRRRIGEQLRKRRDPRGTVRGALLLDLATPLARSAPESRLRLQLIDLGFPLPEVNWPLTDINGRELYYLDLAWPSVRIVVEYDGYASHVDRSAEDAAREVDLTKRGWIVIRADVEDLQNMRELDRELRAAFARRGYRWK